MHHILIVDDEPSFCIGLKRMLARYKDRWQLSFAGNVTDAVEWVNTGQIDLVIADVIMPVKNGFDLLETLQQNETTKNIPVVMMTGASDTDCKVRSLEMGAADLLSKPIKRVDLVARISSCLKLKSYHDQILQQNVTLEKQIKERTRYALLAAEIGSALVKAKNLEDLLQRCCESVANHMTVVLARIWILDEKADRLELKASAGIYTHIEADQRFIPVGAFKIGAIARDKKPHLTNSVIGDPMIRDQAWAKKENITAFAGHPLIVRGRLVGVMAMFSRNALEKPAMEALSSVADKIALGVVQKKSDDKIRFYSFYDPLTHLPNRRFFYVFLGKMINYANRYLTHFALVLVDIDDFNRINESLGHSIGDTCLRIISQRLSDALRNSDCLVRLSGEETPIARMGGDEFAILLHNSEDAHHLSRVVRRLLDVCSKALEVADRELVLSASIGIAVYPDDADSITDLFKNAETALYHAKNKGKNGFAFYSQSMNLESLSMLDLELKMRRAIESRQFRLYFQPKIDVGTMRIMGAEALIRWKDDTGDMISPAQFIPLAESTGMILPIGDWVMETACQQNAGWQKAGEFDISVAVNVSGRQFMQNNFVERVTAFLKSTGLEPGYLELEITETVLMSRPEKAILDLKALKQLGVNISLDDFGTGYSSLAYLQKLPIDYLKIDLSFIRNVLTNQNDAVMVKAIIAMAHNLDLKVIAEGVEDKEQLDFLKVHKCDIVQGYLFSPPVPAQDFAAFWHAFSYP